MPPAKKSNQSCHWNLKMGPVSPTYCWWKQSCTTWCPECWFYPTIKLFWGIQSGAGFFPSTGWILEFPKYFLSNQSIIGTPLKNNMFVSELENRFVQNPYPCCRFVSLSVLQKGCVATWTHHTPTTGPQIDRNPSWTYRGQPNHNVPKCRLEEQSDRQPEAESIRKCRTRPFHGYGM